MDIIEVGIRDLSLKIEQGLYRIIKFKHQRGVQIPDVHPLWWQDGLSTLIHLVLNTRNYRTVMHLCNNSTVYYDHVGAVGTSNLHPDTLVWCFHTWQGVVVLRCYGEDSTHVEPAKEEISAFVKVKAAQTNKIKLADRNCNYRKYKPCPQWPQRTRKGRIRPRSHASLATRSTRRGLACRSRRSCRQPG